MKDESHALHFNPQTAHYGLATAHGALVVNLNATEHGNDALIAHLFEGESGHFAETMTRKLQIMKINGIVDNTF